MFSFKIYC